MRVDIGNQIKYYENYSDNTLPTASEAFESILLEEGRGQFIESFFEFDSEKISFQIKIDGEEAINIDVDSLKDFGYRDTLPYRSIMYDYSGKILGIRFPLPIQFTNSIEFLARTNDGNKTKKLKGYQILLNKEAG